MEDQSNSLLSKNPIGVFSKLAGLAHFPSEKMPLIDLYIETAAGNQNHCALVGNYFIRASTSVIIREKHQVPERDTYRSPDGATGRQAGSRQAGRQTNRQTDTDKTQQKADCSTHSHAILNGKFLITGDELEPGGGLEGLGKSGGSEKVCSPERPRFP